MNESAQGEAVETLVRLGLNCSQAKIYLALVENGLSTAKKISKITGINRQEIYRIMPKLQNVCLVEKLIGIPTRWRATPLEDGLSLLLENRKKETSELQTKTTEIINLIRENKKRAGLQKDEYQFVIMPGKNAHLKWLKNRSKDIQKTNDSILTWSDHKTITFYHDNELKEQLNRGVKTRLIIYVSENEKTLYKNDQTFRNNPNYQKAFIFTPPIVLGGLLDKKQLILATEQNNPIQRSENVFLSNSPFLTALFQNYFEQLWKTAHKHKILERAR
ncbi:MAG: helix-turn-helix domain-containing protein [Candidatus Bathyarchaeota archaeon]|jgi:sugar-specific transcriptional regulator TrmB